MANSPISDATPFTIPTVNKKREIKPDDWKKLGQSKKFPQVNEYLENRKEYFRRYLPSGEPVENLKPEERVAAWDRAVAIIKEIETIQAMIIMHNKR